MTNYRFGMAKPNDMLANNQRFNNNQHFANNGGWLGAGVYPPSSRSVSLPSPMSSTQKSVIDLTHLDSQSNKSITPSSSQSSISLSSTLPPPLLLPQACYNAVLSKIRTLLYKEPNKTEVEILRLVKNDPEVQEDWIRVRGKTHGAPIGPEDQVGILMESMSNLDFVRSNGIGTTKSYGHSDSVILKPFNEHVDKLIGAAKRGKTEGGFRALVDRWFREEKESGVGKGIGMTEETFGKMLADARGGMRDTMKLDINSSDIATTAGMRSAHQQRVVKIRESTLEDMEAPRRHSLEEEIGKYKSPRVLRIEEERRKERERKEEEERVKRQSFRGLTEDEDEMVDVGLKGKGNEQEIMASLDGDSITRRNLWTLRPGGWLSDEVIHYYFSLLRQRDKEKCESTGGRRSWFFKSFFFTKLFEEGKYQYKNVKRWSKKVPGKDIFELENIYWPLNLNNVHWCCMKADMRNKVITYYDSFGTSDSYGFLKATLRYFEDEWNAKGKPGKFEKNEWTLKETPYDYPQQKNGFDCGVFTCTCADFLSAGRETEFTQNDVTKMRRLIALRILMNAAD